GPVVLRLVMEPGAEMGRHYHDGIVANDNLLRGGFMKAWESYPAGTELTVKPGHPPGPHSTPTGVTFLRCLPRSVALTDFHLTNREHESVVWPRQRERVDWGHEDRQNHFAEGSDEEWALVAAYRAPRQTWPGKRFWRSRCADLRFLCYGAVGSDGVRRG